MRARLLLGAAGCATAAAWWWLRLRRRADGALRRDLAAAHALSAHYGFAELVWNHISGRVPGTDEFVVSSGAHHFDEVTEANLITSSRANANVTGDVIHRAIYEARPDVNAIVHHHSLAVVAVGMLPGGLRTLSQDSAAFDGKTAYYEWEGLSDSYDEKARIAEALGAEAHTLIMRNHGACTVGSTVAEAWVRYFYLDVCCRQQMAVAGCGPLHWPDAAAVKHAAAQVASGEFVHGNLEWAALLRQADRLRGRGGLAGWARRALGIL